MSLSEEREILLSQLVDHELSDDRADQVLLETLEDVESWGRLKAMLKLRQTLGPWRRQESPRAIVALPLTRPLQRSSQPGWRPMSLAAAAALGGVLVAGGFYLGGRFNGNRTVATNDQPSVNAPSRPHKAPNPQQPVIVVTPEQRSEINRAFALHESVAGPLSWYAADESNDPGGDGPAGREVWAAGCRRPAVAARRRPTEREQNVHDRMPEQRPCGHRTAAVGSNPIRAPAPCFPRSPPAA